MPSASWITTTPGQGGLPQAWPGRPTWTLQAVSPTPCSIEPSLLAKIISRWAGWGPVTAITTRATSITIPITSRVSTKHGEQGQIAAAGRQQW